MWQCCSILSSKNASQNFFFDIRVTERPLWVSVSLYFLHLLLTKDDFFWSFGYVILLVITYYLILSLCQALLKTSACLLSFRHQNYLLIIHECEEAHIKGIFNVFLLKIESKPWCSGLYKGQVAWRMSVRQFGEEVLHLFNLQLQTLHMGIRDDEQLGADVLGHSYQRFWQTFFKFF